MKLDARQKRTDFGATGRVRIMGEAGSQERRDAAISIAIGVAYFALYLATLCPVVYWYDSAEYVTAAVTLGIPHPPGYPLYVLLGHVLPGCR